ncbi:MAG TPA: hypothetical protein VLA49_15185 [Anaerolineales bacterium]|nr:hypothetical protein [Anaerolineales bacterium]
MRESERIDYSGKERRFEDISGKKRAGAVELIAMTLRLRLRCAAPPLREVARMAERRASASEVEVEA